MSTTGPVKRVTLWVRNAEASLAVYRDALGLSILEDKQLHGPAIARMVGLEQASLRILHLGPPGATHGWVGLYEISRTTPQPMAALPAPEGFPRYGQSTVVITTDDMVGILPKLRKTIGVTLLTEMTEYIKESGTDAMPAGRYSEILFFDPDGISISLMGYAPF